MGSKKEQFIFFYETFQELFLYLSSLQDKGQNKCERIYCLGSEAIQQNLSHFFNDHSSSLPPIELSYPLEFLSQMPQPNAPEAKTILVIVDDFFPLPKHAEEIKPLLKQHIDLKCSTLVLCVSLNLSPSSHIISLFEMFNHIHFNNLSLPNLLDQHVFDISKTYKNCIESIAPYDLELKQQFQSFIQCFNQAKEGILILNSKKQVLYMNHFASTLLGLPFSRETQTFDYSYIIDGMTKESIKHPEGTKHISIHTVPTIWNGTNAFLLHLKETSPDKEHIAQWMRSNKWFNSVFYHTEDPVVFFDKSGKSISFNPSFFDHFKINTKSTSLYFSLFDDPHLSKEAIKTIKNGVTVKFKTPFKTREFEKLTGIPSPDKQKVFEYIISPLKNTSVKEDSLYGYLLKLKDITPESLKQEASTQEQKLLESEVQERTKKLQMSLKELKDANLRLTSLQRSRNQLISNMSHELRTPLNGILGFSELFQEEAFGTMTPKQSNFIKKIESCAQNLLKLINNLLEMSKIDIGEMYLKLEPISLSNLIEETLAMINAQIKKKSLEIKRKDLDLSFPIYTDKAKIHEVLVNLLNNAIEASAPHGKIEISCKVEDSFIVLSIKDEGQGIPTKFHQLIFDEFFQIPETETLKSMSSGSGIGLALSKRLIELHGGKIWVECGSPKGANFFFSLPIEAKIL